MNLMHDGNLIIATGKSRFEKVWTNKTVKWSELLTVLSKSTETSETHDQFVSMPKDQQDNLKDVGGFVGGHLKEGKRRNGFVRARQIITLDADYASADFWQKFCAADLGCAACLYSTHKHTKQNPRYRLIIPLDREVSPDEYEAIARKVADLVGIDYFDDTSFQPARLMYYPSHSRGSDPVFLYTDNSFLSADKVLGMYSDWKDISCWAYSSRTVNNARKDLKKQEDPSTKKGVIGAFCRVYTVPEAIAAYLPDVYEPTAKADRYTYKAGSTSGGLVIYDGGKFAYSNHSTDPAGGQTCNAFDLVRLHLCPDEDKSSSVKKMCDLAIKDDAIRYELLDNKKNKASNKAENWTAALEFDSRSGRLLNTSTNALLIINNDEKLKNFAYNELSSVVEITGDLPWHSHNHYWGNHDNSQLYMYISSTYQVDFKDAYVQKAFDKVASDRSFNPLKDYVRNLPEWDGVKRIETMFTDYLGAEDKEYTREVAKKMMVAAVARVLDPGCKFDEMVVLQGVPGIGKSTFFRKLAGDWYSDALKLNYLNDKKASELLQGVWIMEVGEMQGMRLVDDSALKNFITIQDDVYRPAYGKYAEHHPRTCIICGTTNKDNGFLRDTTGNRKYWPIKVSGKAKMTPFDITDEIRDQLWAEASYLLACGEPLYFDAHLESLARDEQREAFEHDEREGLVIDYLNTLLPADWYTWDIGKRVDYFQNDTSTGREEGTIPREYISLMEIYCECFGKSRSNYKKQDGRDLASIMTRLSDWENAGASKQLKCYGHQRVYTRKF